MFITANAIKYLPTLPSESVDLLITDPPYKIKTRGGRIKDGKCIKDPLKSKWIKKDNEDFIKSGQFMKNIPSFEEEGIKHVWMGEITGIIENGENIS